MSLELAAKHLAAQGRGKDRNLVHMTDREVAGLQALAMSQGGSLTINPETGLPEAGFLDSLLPSIIGFGASALTGGAINPMTIGLLTGVGTAAISGDLSKGLMAGLGAYGGAGLGAGLIGAGTPGGTVLGEAAGFGTPAQPMFTQTPVAQAAQAAQSAPFDLSSMGTVGGGATQALPNALTAPTYSGQIMPATPAVQAAQAIPTVTPTPEIAMPPASELNAQGVARLARQSTAPVAMPDVGETMKAGLGAVAKNPMDFMTKENAMYGLAAAAPMLMATPETTAPEKDTEQYKYIYNPGRAANPEEGYTGAPTGERTYFRPAYTRVLAEGGAVDNEVVDYEYDPLTKTYKKKVTPVAAGAVAPLTAATTSSYRPPKAGEEGYNDWQDKSGLEKAQFFEQRPTWAKLHNLALQGAGLTSVGAVLKAINPEAYAREMAVSSPGGIWSSYAVGPMTEGAQGNIVSQGQAGPLSGEAWGGGSGGGGYSAEVSAPGESGWGSDIGSDNDGYRNGGIAAFAKGRFLEGPGDGVSDSIPATINGTQPARLADGEFVIPARIVSELGNGSSKAGARKLYAMMDRIQKARGQTTGKGKVAANTKAEKYLPA